MKRLTLWRRPYLAGRIIEIGGGHDPYAGVTHAVDKFPDKNVQREGPMVLGKGVVFRKGDLESIPFPGMPKFDFLYASHVLEHSLSAVKAVSEINRVAKRGYIETPSPIREQIISTGSRPKKTFHTLFCWTGVALNTIHVIKKNRKTIGNFCDCENGKIMKILFMCRKRGIDVEPLLPSRAKITWLYFHYPLQLIQHNDFASACRDGKCAYSAVRLIQRRLIAPFYLLSARARKLRKILSN
jgi:hypothetical protein